MSTMCPKCGSRGWPLLNDRCPDCLVKEQLPSTWANCPGCAALRAENERLKRGAEYDAVNLKEWTTAINRASEYREALDDIADCMGMPTGYTTDELVHVVEQMATNRASGALCSQKPDAKVVE